MKHSIFLTKIKKGTFSVPSCITGVEHILNREEYQDEKQEDTLYDHPDGGYRAVVDLLCQG